MKNQIIYDNLRLDVAIRSNKAKENNIENLPNKKQLRYIKDLAKYTICPIVNKYGVCYILGSWFIGEELNKIIKKKADSEHLLGSAVDLIPNSDISAYDLAFYRVKQSDSEYNRMVLNYLQLDDGSWTEWIHLEYRRENYCTHDDYTVIKYKDQEPQLYNYLIDFNVKNHFFY